MNDFDPQIWIDWQNDWNLAADELLGVKLDPEQQEIITSIQHNKLVSVVSGTARGKDFLAAVAAFCFMYLTPKFDEKGNLIENTKVALTAPTSRQVDNIMYPEIVRLFNRAKANYPALPGRLVSSDIRTGYEEWFLTGFKADDKSTEAWTGFHAVNTMFVITEASGIAEATFDAIEGNLQGDSRMLLVFNANKSVGYAAQSQKSERWTKFRLNSLSAPNVKEKKIVIPGQVDYEWITDKLSAWCTKIKPDEIKEELDDFEFEGQWYRPEDLFRIKVLGKFPKVAEDVLIPEQWVELAQQRWHQNYNYDVKKLVLGVDVAGMGRDNTCYCYRYDNFISKFENHNSGGRADHMKVSGNIKKELDSNKHAIASIDTIGEGAGVYSRLVEQGLEQRAISCKYSQSAKDGDRPLTDLTGQYTFANMRAYLFWAVRDWLDPRNDTGAMLPPNQEFIQEASDIRYFFRSDGKIMIEPKEDIKKRLNRSTDVFDSVANCFYPVYRYEDINVSKEDLGIF